MTRIVGVEAFMLTTDQVASDCQKKWVEGDEGGGLLGPWGVRCSGGMNRRICLCVEGRACWGGLGVNMGAAMALD